MEEANKLPKAKQAKRNVLYLTLGIIVCILVVNLGLGSFLANKKQATSPIQTTISTEKTNAADSFSYTGEEGKDALTLLKAKAKEVAQNGTGLVIMINGRKADDSKREYWAFYVNDKIAQVGPAEYKTKKGEKVEWKIEHY